MSELEGPDAPDEIAEFWQVARVHAGLGRFEVFVGPGALASVPPPAWAFGDEPAVADALLALVLAGRKTATSSTLAEYEAADERVPEPGDLSIVLDGEGRPGALIQTTRVDVVPLESVDEDHAAREGEGDGSLAAWRAEHESFWRRGLEPLGIAVGPGLLVVLERFELLHPRPAA